MLSSFKLKQTSSPLNIKYTKLLMSSIMKSNEYIFSNNQNFQIIK